VDVNYSTSPVDETLTGLGLRIHWDSTKLNFVNLTNVLPTNLIATGSPQPDTDNFDGDLSTDMFVNVAWADISAMWPGAGTTPVRLYTANFTSAADFEVSTNVNFSASSTASGWTLDPESATINPELPPEPCTLTVMKAGSCGGTVTDTGIDCGTDCEQEYVCETVVNLMQTADPGCIFAGWGGQCSADGMVTMDTDKECTATFDEACTLKVIKAGTGTGTVTDTGIDCGTDCEQIYACGTKVDLTQMADSGSEFVGFTGADSDCSDGQVNVDADKECTAIFDLKPTLTVKIAGAGSGKVTDTDINCEPNCSANFPKDSVVNLTAAADPVSSDFAGWSGDCSNGSVTTQVTMDADKECTATFNLKDKFSLNVSIAGTGTGKVADTAIACEPDCSASFFEDTVVKLTAMADPDSDFAGWSGDCPNGSATTQVTMDANKSCTAAFDLITFVLQVGTAGNGSGTVMSSPGDIDCGDTCSGTFPIGTDVDLTATADDGSVFKEWTGDCDADGMVTMDAAKNCTAVFNIAAPDHFLCYNIKPKRKFSSLEVSLSDQFEKKEYRVKKSHRLCNPADKNGEGIQDPESHLVAYKIKRVKGESKSEKRTDVRVENQFGVISVETKQPDRLLVPTAKSLDGDAKSLDGSSSLDHYKCYKIKLSSGQSFPNDLQASVVDQFDQETLYDIKKPQRLCNPVDKNGEGINNDNDENHLLCYKIGRASGEPKHEKVEGIRTTNQFGSGEVTAKKAKELCVPSIKTISD